MPNLRIRLKCIHTWQDILGNQQLMLSDGYKELIKDTIDCLKETNRNDNQSTKPEIPPEAGS